MRGDPFVPKLAVAVDMFPHTPHCELVMLFERQAPEKDVAEVEATIPLGQETGDAEQKLSEN